MGAIRTLRAKPTAARNSLGMAFDRLRKKADSYQGTTSRVPHRADEDESFSP
jgi:hypothetical protein